MKEVNEHLREVDSSSPPTPEELVERILSEGPIGMTAAAKLLGSYRQGKPTHPSTVTRWCIDGVKVSKGCTVRLEHIRMNGRLVTSRAAVIRFLAAQQPSHPPPETEVPIPRSPSARDRAVQRAARELDQLGVGRLRDSRGKNCRETKRG